MTVIEGAVWTVLGDRLPLPPLPVNATRQDKRDYEHTRMFLTEIQLRYPGGGPPENLVDASIAAVNQHDSTNTDTGFRNGSGVEFSDYKSGFDASVSHYSYESVPGDDSKKVFTGLSGVPDILFNTVSYWGFGGDTSFKLTLHCTSDINQAVVYPK